ncbi:MAG: MBL fold metallo-hydrolase [Planctomycetota bacterium]|nr:MBL fold metallo-hydrolase [Planctomycetota bacterium]
MHFPEIQCSIDDFRPAARVYLLTHFHTDHMRGLKKGRQRGRIVCSAETAALLAEINATPLDDIVILEKNHTASFTECGRRWTVTAHHANHCAGALMFLVETVDRRILFTGDFRLDDEIRATAAAIGPVDLLCVDCTYDRPQYRFPSQDVCIDRILDAVRVNPDKEIMIGIYSLGKEKILEALFRTFKQPIYMTKDEFRRYKAIGLDRLATQNRGATRFRAYAMGFFGKYFRANPDRSLVVIPTGWAVDRRNVPAGFLYVPYSEHCDYDELCEFKRIVKAGQVVPTETR